MTIDQILYNLRNVCLTFIILICQHVYRHLCFFVLNPLIDITMHMYKDQKYSRYKKIVSLKCNYSSY